MSLCARTSALVWCLWFLAASGFWHKEQGRKQGSTPIRRCVDRYAEGLDAVKVGLGASMRAHPLVAAAVSDQRLVIGGGMGSTATRSLEHALQMLGLKVNHGTNIDVFGAIRIMAPDGLWKPAEQRHRLSQSEVSACREALRRTDYTGTGYDAVLDTPVAESFVNLILSYPKARVILTTRPAKDWVAKRGNDLASFVPMQEPCGLFTGYPPNEFDDQQLATMLELQDELVRCSVPPERLLEINVWEEPPARMDGIMAELADFLGRPRLSANATFPHEG